MSKIHESLGLDEAETLCFYMCLHLCKHESRIKKGEEKKVKIGMRGILNIFPSSTSENDLFAASWVDKVWMCVCVRVFGLMVLDTLVINKSWHSRCISEITSFIRKMIYESTMILLGQPIFGQNHSLWLHNSFFLCSFGWAARNPPYEGLSAKHASLSDTSGESWRMAKRLGECWRHHKSMDLLILLIVELRTFALFSHQSVAANSPTGV